MKKTFINMFQKFKEPFKHKNQFYMWKNIYLYNNPYTTKVRLD